MAATITWGPDVEQAALHDPRASTDARRVHTAVVLGLALVARLAVIRFVLVRFPSGWLFTRGIEMSLLAKSLLAGQGLSSPFGVPTGPTAMIAPAYPVLLAGIFHLFGVETQAAAIAVMGLHTLLNLLTVCLILGLARRIADEQSAVVVCALWACSLPVIEMPAILWETSFSACFLLGAVGLATTLHRESSLWQWVAGGAGCAVAGLFNPALLPSLLLLGLVAAVLAGRRAWAKAVVALLVFAAVFSPWPLRNARVFHALIPLRTTVGLELWMGNRPGATGYLDESVFPAFNPAELRKYVQRGELGYTREKQALAITHIRAEPAVFVHMTALRFWRFWSGTGTRNGPLLFPIHAGVTALLGMAGALLLLSSRYGTLRRCGLVLLVPLLAFPLPYYVTHAEFRYRLVLDPVLAVLCAHAVSRWRHARGFEAIVQGPPDQ